MKKTLLGLVLGCVFPFVYGAERIVTLTPDVADVVVALGSADDVVGRDMATQNPALKNVPSIGIFRQLSAEPIAAQQPTVAIGSWMAQPASIFANLNRVGIKAVNVAPEDNIAEYPESIRKIGELIGKEAEADALAKKWQAEMQALPETGKRYLFTYDGRIVAGKNTAADTLIHLAGGINAAASIEGLKPMTREAWLAAKPDIIFISAHQEQAIGGIAGFLQRPEVAASPAGKNRKVFLAPANDLFRYGLDTPQVLAKLHQLAQ